jgi:hypothetical protein
MSLDKFLLKLNRVVNDYKISEVEYVGLFIIQSDKCAICGERETALSKSKLRQKTLAIDHSHSTGEVRGLLCMRCNTAISKFDQQGVIDNLVWYLTKDHKSFLGKAGRECTKRFFQIPYKSRSRMQ